jgi:hypothetical protein
MSATIDRRPAVTQVVKTMGKSSAKPVGVPVGVTVPKAPISPTERGKSGRPRGRPPTNPVRLKPTVTSKDILSPARLVEPTSVRPMIWKDLPVFAMRHGRSSMEMMYDLGFNTTYQYTSAANKAEVLPFDLELLIRIFEVYPSSCSWKKTTPSQAIDLIYGDLLQPYLSDPDEEGVMRMHFGQRLAAILDRSVTVLYRWLTDAGASSRRVINILSKVEAMGDTPQARREAFEGIALPAWRLRGIDIEQTFKLASNFLQNRQMNSEVRDRLLEAKRQVEFQPGTGSFL